MVLGSLACLSPVWPRHPLYTGNESTRPVPSRNAQFSQPLILTNLQGKSATRWLSFFAGLSRAQSFFRPRPCYRRTGTPPSPVESPSLSLVMTFRRCPWDLCRVIVSLRALSMWSLLVFLVVWSVVESWDWESLKCV